MKSQGKKQDNRQKEDKVLIKRMLKRRDKKAADCLIRAYYDEIYAYVYKQVFDKSMAMDLTQDIFLHMLKGLQHYDSSKASFRTWLYKLATNLIIDYMRQQSRQNKREHIIDDIMLVDDTEPLIKITNREKLDQIMTFIETVDFDIQQIFTLKIFAEKTFMEISQILSIKESTIKTKYYRLIKVIKERFYYEN